MSGCTKSAKSLSTWMHCHGLGTSIPCHSICNQPGVCPQTMTVPLNYWDRDLFGAERFRSKTYLDNLAEGARVCKEAAV
jgi:hypothetical protein